MKTKRQRRAKIVKKLIENAEEGMIVQRQPWTAVVFFSTYKKERVRCFGFAKVCYPDVFDESAGIMYAVRKALSQAAKEIMGDATVPSRVGVFDIGIVNDETFMNAERIE